MAIGEENGGGMVMPVTPMGGGYGGNDGFGFGGGWWIILLFVLLGGFGNGFGGFGGGNDFYPWMNQSNQISSGFANQANNIALNGLQDALNTGFAGISNQLSNGQMSALERSFAEQTAVTNGFFNLQSQLATCCCENRLATQGLQSVIQSENCADRAAVSEGIRDILVAQNANTQKILDMMCQDKIDAKNEKILELQNALNMANLAASQTRQTSTILASNALQTQTLEELIAASAAPAA